MKMFATITNMNVPTAKFHNKLHDFSHPLLGFGFPHLEQKETVSGICAQHDGQRTKNIAPLHMKLIILLMCKYFYNITLYLKYIIIFYFILFTKTLYEIYQH